MSIRVNQGNSLVIDKHRPSGTNQRIPSFDQELTKVRDTHKLEIDSLLKKIDEAGEQLAKNITLRNLQNYKAALKNLLNKIANGHGLKTEHIWNHQGQSRILTSIREIEKHLADLTEEVTSQNANQISILTKIGEIKGIVVDLYA